MIILKKSIEKIDGRWWIELHDDSLFEILEDFAEDCVPDPNDPTLILYPYRHVNTGYTISPCLEKMHPSVNATPELTRLVAHVVSQRDYSHLAKVILESTSRLTNANSTSNQSGDKPEEVSYQNDLIRAREAFDAKAYGIQGQTAQTAQTAQNVQKAKKDTKEAFQGQQNSMTFYDHVDENGENEENEENGENNVKFPTCSSSSSSSSEEDESENENENNRNGFEPKHDPVSDHSKPISLFSIDESHINSALWSRKDEAIHADIKDKVNKMRSDENPTNNESMAFTTFLSGKVPGPQNNFSQLLETPNRLQQLTDKSRAAPPLQTTPLDPLREKIEMVKRTLPPQTGAQPTMLRLQSTKSSSINNQSNVFTTPQTENRFVPSARNDHTSIQAKHLFDPQTNPNAPPKEEKWIAENSTTTKDDQEDDSFTGSEEDLKHKRQADIMRSMFNKHVEINFTDQKQKETGEIEKTNVATANINSDKDKTILYPSNVTLDPNTFRITERLDNTVVGVKTQKELEKVLMEKEKENEEAKKKYVETNRNGSGGPKDAKNKIQKDKKSIGKNKSLMEQLSEFGMPSSMIQSVAGKDDSMALDDPIMNLDDLLKIGKPFVSTRAKGETTTSTTSPTTTVPGTTTKNPSTAVAPKTPVSSTTGSIGSSTSTSTDISNGAFVVHLTKVELLTIRRSINAQMASLATLSQSIDEILLK